MVVECPECGTEYCPDTELHECGRCEDHGWYEGRRCKLCDEEYATDRLIDERRRG